MFSCHSVSLSHDSVYNLCVDSVDSSYMGNPLVSSPRELVSSTEPYVQTCSTTDHSTPISVGPSETRDKHGDVVSSHMTSENSGTESSISQCGAHRHYSIEGLLSKKFETVNDESLVKPRDVNLKLQGVEKGKSHTAPRYSIAELRRIGHLVESNEKKSAEAYPYPLKLHYVMDKDSLCALSFNAPSNTNYLRRVSYDHNQSTEARNGRRNQTDYLIYTFDEFRRIGKGVWSKRRPHVVHPLIDNGLQFAKGRPAKPPIASSPAKDSDSLVSEHTQPGSIVKTRRFLSASAPKNHRRASDVQPFNGSGFPVCKTGSSSANMSSSIAPHNLPCGHIALPASVDNRDARSIKPLASIGTVLPSRKQTQEFSAQFSAYPGASKLLQAALRVGGTRRTPTKPRSTKGSATCGSMSTDSFLLSNSAVSQESPYLVGECSSRGGSATNMNNGLLGPLPSPSMIPLLSKAPPLLPPPYGTSSTPLAASQSTRSFQPPKVTTSQSSSTAFRAGSSSPTSSSTGPIRRASCSSYQRPVSNSQQESAASHNDVRTGTTEESAKRVPRPNGFSTDWLTTEGGGDSEVVAGNKWKKGVAVWKKVDKSIDSRQDRGDMLGEQRQVRSERQDSSNVSRSYAGGSPCAGKDLWDVPSTNDNPSTGIFSLGSLKSCEEAMAQGMDFKSYVRDVIKQSDFVKKTARTGQQSAKEEGELTDPDEAGGPEQRRVEQEFGGGKREGIGEKKYDDMMKMGLDQQFTSFFDDEGDEETYAGSRFLPAIIGRGRDGNAAPTRQGSAAQEASSSTPVSQESAPDVSGTAGSVYPSHVRNVQTAVSHPPVLHGIPCNDALPRDTCERVEGGSGSAPRAQKQVSVKLGEEDGRRAGRFLLGILNASSSPNPSQSSADAGVGRSAACYHGNQQYQDAPVQNLCAPSASLPSPLPYQPPSTSMYGMGYQGYNQGMMGVAAAPREDLSGVCLPHQPHSHYVGPKGISGQGPSYISYPGQTSPPMAPGILPPIPEFHNEGPPGHMYCLHENMPRYIPPEPPALESLGRGGTPPYSAENCPTPTPQFQFPSHQLPAPPRMMQQGSISPYPQGHHTEYVDPNWERFTMQSQAQEARGDENLQERTNLEYECWMHLLNTSLRRN